MDELQNAQSMQIIKCVDDLHLVKTFLSKNVYIAYDLETTGLNVRKDSIIGVGLSNKEQGFYLVHKHYNLQTQDFDYFLSKEQICSILNIIEQRNQLITHNGSFDLRFTKNFFGVDLVENLFSDSMMAKHTVQEERPFGLKDLAADIFGEDVIEEQQLMKASIKSNGGSTNEFYKADLDLMAKYCIKDCILTYKLNEHYLQKIKEENLSKFYFQDEVIPLYKWVTIPMESIGVRLDIPSMQKALEDITEDIKLLDTQIQSLIKPHLALFESWFLDKDYPVSRTPANAFVHALAEHLGIEVPRTKNGSFSFTAKNLEKLPTGVFKDFMLMGAYLPKDLIREVQLRMHGDQPMFNLTSKFHLKKLFFDTLKEQPLSTTDKGAPQIDEDFLVSMSEKYEAAKLLIDFNKLNKLKGTYIERLLEDQEDGVYYPSFWQNNTISGRYGSDLQQMPRPLEEGQASTVVIKYTNMIRSFIIAGPDRKLVGADQESLEPKVFAHVSNENALRDIFKNGEDFYSKIACLTEGLHEYSPLKTAPNYLGKMAKAKRQTAKAYALGIPYGMSDYKLQYEINVSQKEAQRLINQYLSAFPNLASWMESSKQKACQYGYISSEAGRVRHMPKLKNIWSAYGEDILDSLTLWKKYNDNPRKYEQMKYLRKEAVNFINNSRNFQIQSLAASIINRAAIAIAQEIKNRKLDATICLNLHDELLLTCAKNQAEQVAELLQRNMETAYKISVPLLAKPEIGDRYSDVK